MKKIFLFVFCLAFLPTTAQTITASLGYQGYEEDQAYFGEGEYEIYLDNIDGVLDHPVIIMDGFDPGDSSGLSDLYAALDFNGANLADILRDEGFDFVALNFPQYTTDGKDIDGGADYIQRNAMVLIELINEINSQKEGDNELVIIGPSMGGLISQYALSYMEQNNLSHETRLFISFDSPHLGANIPVNFQYLINFFAKELDIAEAQFTVDNVLNSPAAKEMLIDHYLGHLLNGSDYEQDPSLLLPVGAPDFRDAFQSELDNLGFPENVRNVTIINGSGTGQTTGTPGMQIINENFDLGNNLSMDIELKFTPEAGMTNTVTRYTGYLIGIPLQNYEAQAESFAFTDGMDSAPGGKGNLTSGLGDIDNEIIELFLEALEQEEYSFIPTISALAISNEDNWYAAPVISDSPFDNVFIPSENEEHVTLTQENADFALEEIRMGVLSVSDYLASIRYKLVENPVKENIKVRLDNSQLYRNINIFVSSVSGQRILSKAIQSPKDELQIPVSLSPGVYILHIQDSKTTFVKKLFVN